MQEVKEIVEDIKEKFPNIYRNKDFMLWFNSLIDKVIDKVDSGYTDDNLSLITLAYHQYPNLKIGEKVGIGATKEEKNDVAELFIELFNKYCKDEKVDRLFDRLFDDADWIAIQLEYDGKDYIWHFYLHEDGKIYGVNCKDGKLVEYKEYDIKNKRVVDVKGKHKRLQYNLEIGGKDAFKFIRWLYDHGYISGDMKAKCEKMILGDYKLDTISSSPTRGICLYFD